MNQRLNYEIDRLTRVFAEIHLDLRAQPGASAFDVRAVEQRVGIDFDDALRGFWQSSNGCHASWFAYGDDEDALLELCTPLRFLSLAEASDLWSQFEPYDESIYLEWRYDGLSGARDARIQPHFLRHRLWFPFADSGDGSPLLQFDADPTDKGAHGQVIAFVHDPNQVDFVAPSFLDFFSHSNSILEHALHDDPDELREWLDRW